MIIYPSIKPCVWQKGEYDSFKPHVSTLTHWSRVTHICVSKLTIIGSDNGLSPGRRQAIIWTNAGILSIRILGTNFSEILSEIHAFSFKKMHLKMASAKWRPFCLGLNALKVFQNYSSSVQIHLQVSYPRSRYLNQYWHFTMSTNNLTVKSAAVGQLDICPSVRKISLWSFLWINFNPSMDT